MNEQELIERIILEIEKYGIEVIGDNYFPLDAVTHNRKKITIFNPKTVKAFKLCHELMHIKNNDRYRLGECDTTSLRRNGQIKRPYSSFGISLCPKAGILNSSKNLSKSLVVRVTLLLLCSVKRMRK
ncbi:hypothetical protein N568_0105155 [Lactococcus garvieae TRF1]|uniref:IrrE N-terminal-like domain-containing protein n=1 Tax=Lactococcus garvieae TRF1 TaxID=1380772 RepID=V8APV6_9LACT|nr:hypothetical protein N568_0105155 [Lactococcus garvieae TRF1]